MSLGGVLITGGTGFLGRNLVRHILERNLSERVCVLSRGEHAQADMRADFNDDERLRFFIGDCRDYARLRRAFKGVDVVVHAAALKRIETGFFNPVESIRTNIDGTLAVIEASQDAGVKKVLFISSDKSVEAKSIYGLTKAVGEAAILAANNTVGSDGPAFSVCRWGNVWMSAGSIVPKWQAMVAKGARAVPVTDPECTRFMLKIDDAISLIINTIQTMEGGELVIPEMPAFRVGDLVEAMGVLSSVTGLPEWEKRHESIAEGVTSDKAPRLTVEDLRTALAA